MVRLITALLLAAGLFASDRPNIVLIVADDLGWKDLGCYGHPVHRTPHLDQLAAEGLRLTDAYASAPNCAPTRAAILSGQYAPRTGVYTVGSSKRGKSKNRALIPVENRTDLDEGVVTLAETLQASGYRTACMGKWHLSKDPRDHGFDVNVAGTTWGHPKRYHSPYGNPFLEDGEKGEYLTDRLASEAASFISESTESPFFLYLPFYTVHTPIQPRKDRLAAVKDRVGDHHAAYAAMVEGMDEAIGVVLASVQARGIEEETLVVFLSDNGGHGRYTDMGPLSGSKGMMNEGGIRVSWIVHQPGTIPVGVSSVPQIGVDLYPTLCEAAGAALPAQPLDGVSLLDHWKGGKKPERDALYFHFPVYLQAYLPEQGNWRLTPSSAIREGRFKLIETFEDGELRLYNLAKDPAEANECSARHPDVVQRLHQKLARWREEIGAEVPTERNPEYEPK